jgi:hypothetical protein
MTMTKRPGRSVGEGTQAVRQVLRNLGAVGEAVEGVTWREVFARSRMSRRAVQSTLQHMVEREEVDVRGVRHVANISKPMRLYALKQTDVEVAAPTDPKASAVLSAAMFRICGVA